MKLNEIVKSELRYQVDLRKELLNGFTMECKSFGLQDERWLRSLASGVLKNPAFIGKCADFDHEQAR